MRLPGGVLLPRGQEKILPAKAFENPPLERVVLHILDGRFDLALVASHPRFARQNHRPIMARKLFELRMELGIVPVRPKHSRLEIIDHHRRRHSAQMPERILHTAEEGLAVLPPDRFAVALARTTQHAAKQVRFAPFPLLDHPRSLAEIDLQFLARRAFHAPKRQLRSGRL